MMQGRLQFANQGSRDKYWAKHCPPIYQETVEEKLPQAARSVLQKLNGWQPDHGKGLVFIGPSRRGKSRLAWYILKRHVLERGIEVKHYDGIGWPLAVAGAFGSPVDTEKWMDSVCQAQVLFLDDAFKQRFTEAQESAYLGVLERRAAYKLPLIMTFNSTAQQLRERMTAAGAADRFEPIIRRIEEFNHVFTF